MTLTVSRGTSRIVGLEGELRHCRVVDRMGVDMHVQLGTWCAALWSIVPAELTARSWAAANDQHYFGPTQCA